MHTAIIARTLGSLLLLLSVTFVPPMIVEQWYQDGQLAPFEWSFGMTLCSGSLLSLLFQTSQKELRTHDSFLLVILFWITTSVVSALPLYLAFPSHLSFTDAFFESVSGITTTGSTIFRDLDKLPHSILYYRQQLQFVGGISIIILAVAILPTLGIGGMQLFRTEITGPIKNDKILPRLAEGAKAIWLVYVSITALCAVCYWGAGMSCFDAIAHSFSTVSTGGFSTHNQSLGFYNSPAIQIVATVFMILGAINFNLHFLVFKSARLYPYQQDPELLFFLKLFLLITLLIWTTLIFCFPHNSLIINTINAIFETASFISTTGLSSSTILSWPLWILILLLFLGLIGGCAGSTSGGIKAVRALLLQKQAALEIRRLIHPRGKSIVKFGQKALSGQIIEAIWGFFAIYFVVFIFLFLLLLTVENDFLTAYTSLIASLSNSGRGWGKVIENSADLSQGAKWILSMAMLLGRLEIFTVLVILSPAFWKR